MTRHEATKFAREELVKHGLSDWGIRLNQNAESHFLGLCIYGDKTIVLSAHHIDIHPTPDVMNTIRHEVAHALTEGHGHDEVWEAKAREVGCDNTQRCSNLSLSPDIIDAIRSGATVEVTFDEQVIRTPKYTITRLQDKCPYCGKVAKSLDEHTVAISNPEKPDLKFIRLECGHTLVKEIPKGTPFWKFQAFGDIHCDHKWNKNKCEMCGRCRPYDFQLEGMAFIEAALSVNNGGAIFDEMGLGKTIQAEGVLFFHPEWQPTLWIVKAGLKYQQSTAIINWMGDEHVPQVIETSKDYLIPGLKNYIIGYDMLVPKSKKLKSGKIVTSGFDISQFDRVGIKCVVLDECQQIKNVDSTRTQMVRRVVKGRKVIALSGTPWKNRGSELFPVFNMMDPMRFSSEQQFKNYWVEKYWVGNRLKEGGIAPHRIQKFKEYIKDLAIRRERTEVLKELPLINRTKLNIKMTPDEEKEYDAAVDEFIEWYEEQQGAFTGMAIIGAMQKMRHLIAVAKLPATLEYIDEFVEETDRKLVIFVHHIDVQQMMYNELKERYDSDEIEDRVPVYYIRGGMNPYDRNEIQTSFNNAPRALMVASQLAASEGLNLQTCSDCVMHERQWNPGNEEQAEGRFIRIGSTATVVNAVYTHADGMNVIDPHLDSIVEGKRLRFHAAMSTGEMPRWNEDVLMKELADAIVSAHARKRAQQQKAS